MNARACPRCGSGTTGVVALALQRNFVGIELNPKYTEMARRRIDTVAPLFVNVGTQTSGESADEAYSPREVLRP